MSSQLNLGQNLQGSLLNSAPGREEFGKQKQMPEPIKKLLLAEDIDVYSLTSVSFPLKETGPAQMLFLGLYTF